MKVVDEGDIIAFYVELAEAEKQGARIPIEVGPFAAMTMIDALQLAMRHPDMSLTQLAQIQPLIDQLKPAFAGTFGETIIEMGERPEFDG